MASSTSPFTVVVLILILLLSISIVIILSWNWWSKNRIQSPPVPPYTEFPTKCECGSIRMKRKECGQLIFECSDCQKRCWPSCRDDVAVESSTECKQKSSRELNLKKPCDDLVEEHINETATKPEYASAEQIPQIQKQILQCQERNETPISQIVSPPNVIEKVCANNVCSLAPEPRPDQCKPKSVCCETGCVVTQQPSKKEESFSDSNAQIGKPQRRFLCTECGQETSCCGCDDLYGSGLTPENQCAELIVFNEHVQDIPELSGVTMGELIQDGVESNRNQCSLSQNYRKGSCGLKPVSRATNSKDAWMMYLQKYGDVKNDTLQRHRKSCIDGDKMTICQQAACFPITEKSLSNNAPIQSDNNLNPRTATIAAEYESKEQSEQNEEPSRQREELEQRVRDMDLILAKMTNAAAERESTPEVNQTDGPPAENVASNIQKNSKHPSREQGTQESWKARWEQSQAEKLISEKAQSVQVNQTGSWQSRLKDIIRNNQDSPEIKDFKSKIRGIVRDTQRSGRNSAAPKEEKSKHAPGSWKDKVKKLRK